MDDNYIKDQLTKFNVTDTAIVQLTDKYKDLKIQGIEDTSGYKAVRAARLEVKGYRVDIEKRRKELTEDALKYQRAINAEAKRITALLEPLEIALSLQEDNFEKEKERIKQEELAARHTRMQSRISELMKYGFKFDGSIYFSEFRVQDGGRTFNIPPSMLETLSDDDFVKMMDDIKNLYAIYIKQQELEEQRQKEAKEKEDAERKEEQERLAKEREELELEKEKLRKQMAEIAKNQAEATKQEVKEALKKDDIVVTATTESGEKINIHPMDLSKAFDDEPSYEENYKFTYDKLSHRQKNKIYMIIMEYTYPKVIENTNVILKIIDLIEQVLFDDVDEEKKL